ncbi:MAG: ABC transporter substrate-binding protein [Erysipelotrichaceae bacterium]
MKKLLAILTALVVTAGVSGCSNAPADPNGLPSDLTELEAEITWWAFPTFATVDGVSGQYEQSLVTEFNKKYPNIKVNVEMIDFQNGPEKIINAVQAGTQPDVLFDAPGRIIDYGTSGYLVNLNELYEETGLEKDAVNDAVLKASSDGENYWMYPTSAAPFVMAVSKTALEEAGLLGEMNFEGDRTWTTEEFIELSKKMAAKGYKGVEIYAGGQGGDQGTRAFITNLTGATIMDSGLTKYTMDTPEGVEAFELVMQGVNEGWLTGNTAGVANDAIAHFTTPTNSKFWALNLWSPNLANARKGELEAAGIEAIAVSLPSKDGNPNLEYLVNGYAIFDSKDATRIAASKEFVKFLADDETVGKQNVMAANCFPVRKSFGDLYEGNEDMTYYDSLSKYYGSYYNTVPGFASMRPFWWGSLQAMLTGDKTPADAAKYFVENANPTLDE